MLYMVSTPIGNLSDITIRALDVLKSVDFVICEDTRQTAKLLNKYGIKKKTTSLHQHSSEEKLNMIANELKEGKSAAYLTDGGTPNLSDPGAKLAEIAYKNQIQLSPIPGPSTLSALISVAPFMASDFRFIGFFPKKKGREKMASAIDSCNFPVFFYESPKRIRKTLLFLSERLAGRKALIGRELTKIYEEISILDLSEVNEHNINQIPEKGEFIVAIFS